MPREHGCITRVDGVRVGHAVDDDGVTGCSVILFDQGAVAGVDIGGSAPATRETELLDPTNMIERIHGIALTGGSVFGLKSSDGVQSFLRERGVGYRSSAGVIIPIVPAAAIYDLEMGDPAIHHAPDRKMGYSACETASSDMSPEGLVGCGVGATCGRILGNENRMRGGLGSSSITLSNGVTVGTLVVCNAWGDVLDPDTGQIVAGAIDPKTDKFLDTEAYMFAENTVGTTFFGSNTTLCVVATNARFSREQITKIANMAQDGIARAVRPSHTLYDGDIVFAASTGTLETEVNLNIVGALAARLIARSIVHGVSLANGGLKTEVKEFNV